MDVDVQLVLYAIMLQEVLTAVDDVFFTNIPSAPPLDEVNIFFTLIYGITNYYTPFIVEAITDTEMSGIQARLTTCTTTE